MECILIFFQIFLIHFLPIIILIIPIIILNILIVLQIIIIFVLNVIDQDILQNNVPEFFQIFFRIILKWIKVMEEEGLLHLEDHHQEEKDLLLLLIEEDQLIDHQQEREEVHLQEGDHRRIERREEAQDLLIERPRRGKGLILREKDLLSLKRNLVHLLRNEGDHLHQNENLLHLHREKGLLNQRKEQNHLHLQGGKEPEVHQLKITKKEEKMRHKI